MAGLLADGELFAFGRLALGHELVELLARAEPFLNGAQKHVVHRQPAGDRVLPQGVLPQADAATLQRHERFLERRQGLTEPRHLGPRDLTSVPRLEHGVLQAQL